MPAGLSLWATVLGAVSDFFPIGWIVPNVIFMYQLTLASGRFETAGPLIGDCSCCLSPDVPGLDKAIAKVAPVVQMIDAQSIVVASTEWFGHEGTILLFVFKHSIILACLVGILVMLQAHVYRFTEMMLK